MKEQILQLLKKKAENSQVSEKTLEAFAVVLASKATETSKIEDFDEEATALVNTVQGNVNHIVSNAKAEWDKINNPTPPIQTPPVQTPPIEKPDNMAETLKQVLGEALKPIQDELNTYKGQLDDYKQKEVRGKMVSDARNKIAEQYKLEKNDKVFASIFNLVSNKESTDEIVAAFNEAYKPIQESADKNAFMPHSPTVTKEQQQQGLEAMRQMYISKGLIKDNN